MATYVATVKFTDQGAKNVRNTCDRAASFTETAGKLNIKVRELFWTLGGMDGLLVFDAPDEDAATAAMLHLAADGNVTTSTSRAYNAEEMKGVLAKLP